MPHLDDHLRGWAPRPVVEADPMPPDPARALAAILESGDTFTEGDELPPLWHWAYFLTWPPLGELGDDGHPAAGHFLPPVPDRRRMFAGGRVTIARPLTVGVPAERTQTLGAVTVKSGRSGEMAFVTVRSEYRQGGDLRLTEEQDYVYRSGESAAKTPDMARPRRPPDSDAAWQQPFTGAPVLLFRFSALTANSHRIHYDAPYAREVESYPDLVVHGPLLVLRMIELARRGTPGRSVVGVDYRLRRPVFAGDPVLVVGDPAEEAELSVRSEPDTVHAQATIRFD